GVRQVLWLGRGIVGDDTHGHIDDLARFVGPRTVATVVEADPADPNFEPLQDNLRRLRAIKDLDVVPLPMPSPVVFDGQRLPASSMPRPRGTSFTPEATMNMRLIPGVVALLAGMAFAQEPPEPPAGRQPPPERQGQFGKEPSRGTQRRGFGETPWRQRWEYS